MQLVQLPRLRQATQEETQKLQDLPLFVSRLQGGLGDANEKQLLEQLFHLLHSAEKQILPFFSKMTREEFDWLSWLLSPELGRLLLRHYQFLPQPCTEAGIALELRSLPQALGSAWALLHVSGQLVQLLPIQQPRCLDTHLLQQLETLAQIYCSGPADLLETQQAARTTLRSLCKEIASWADQEVVNSSFWEATAC